MNVISSTYISARTRRMFSPCDSILSAATLKMPTCLISTVNSVFSRFGVRYSSVAVFSSSSVFLPRIRNYSSHLYSSMEWDSAVVMTRLGISSEAGSRVMSRISPSGFSTTFCFTVSPSILFTYLHD